MRKNYEKRINDKWRKALKSMGINENLYPSRKQDLKEFHPFCENTIANVKLGRFIEHQIDKIVLEIVNFEVINGCFHVKMKDIDGEEI